MESLGWSFEPGRKEDLSTKGMPLILPKGKSTTSAPLGEHEITYLKQLSLPDDTRQWLESSVKSLPKSIPKAIPLSKTHSTKKSSTQKTGRVNPIATSSLGVTATATKEGIAAQMPERASGLARAFAAHEAERKDEATIRELESYTPEQHTAKKAEITQFENQMKSLFGTTPLFRSLYGNTQKLINLHTTLKTLHKSLEKAADTEKPAIIERYRAIDKEIQAANSKICQLLVNHAKEVGKQKGVELTSASKLLRDTYLGLHRRQCLDGAEKAHTQMVGLQRDIEKQAKAVPATAAKPFLSPEQRRQIYGNVTYIREHARDLESRDLKDLVAKQKKLEGQISKLTGSHQEKELKKAQENLKSLDATQQQMMQTKIEKLEKTVAKVKTAFQSKASVQEKWKTALAEKDAVEQEIKMIKGKYQNLKNTIDEYYNQFSFTDEELQSPAFQELSVEARRATRGHLGMFAGDIVKGARKWAEGNSLKFYDQMKNRINAELIRINAELKEKPHPELSKLLTEKNIDWEKVKGLLQESGNEKLEQLSLSLILMEEALENFEKACKEQEENIMTDPRLEGGKPKEKLPPTKEGCKAAEKGAFEANQVVINALLEACIILQDTHESPKDPKAQRKEISEQLGAARDAVISDRTRWSVPIDRTITLPNGNPLRHKMTCPNQGYASSGFRGRSPKENPIQPNWWDVEIGVGGQQFAFSRSAIQNEFFSSSDADRMQSTKVQVMEVLSQKAEKQFQKMKDKEPHLGTKDKPFRVQTTEVSLLSPDSIRAMMATQPEFAHLVKAKTGWSVDVSNWELRILQENHAAWTSFDIANAKNSAQKDGDTFEYIDNNGERRQVIVHVKGEGDKKEIVYEIVREDKEHGRKSIFVQFDIAYYNVGCDQITKIMADEANRAEGEAKIQKAAQGIIDTLFKKIGFFEKFLTSKVATKVATKAAKWYFGIELTEEQLKYFLDQKLPPVDRLAAVLPAVVKGLLTTPEGLAELQKELAKAGVNIGAINVETLKQIKLPNIKVDPSKPLTSEQVLQNGLLTLKAVLGNKEVQRIIQPLIKKEMNITVSIPDLDQIANSIPDKFKVDERIGVDTIFQHGFPILKALLANPTGRQLLQFAAAEKGKPLSEKELKSIELPAYFEPKYGNELEEKMNHAAFEKHKERVETRLRSIGAEKRSLKEKITSAAEIDETRVVWDKIERIQRTREALLKTEANYRKDHSPANQKAFENALKAWQGARDDVFHQLDSILNDKTKPRSEALLKYIKLTEYEETLLELSNEVEDQLAFKIHRNPEYMKKNMYSLSSTIMALSILLEENPNTGCRSGKDRTSIQDMEITTKLAMLHMRGKPLSYREMEMDPLTIEVREQALLHTGQIDELAYKNIGSYGLNLSGSYGSYLGNFGSGPSGKEWEHTIVGGAAHAFTRSFK